MAAETRVYKVVITVPPGGEKVTKLIRAQNKVQPLNHVAKGMIAVEIATQDDLIELVSKGVKVEEAGEEPEPSSDFL